MITVEKRRELEKLILPEKVYTINKYNRGYIAITEEEALKLGYLEIVTCLGKDLSENFKDLIIGQLYLDNK